MKASCVILVIIYMPRNGFMVQNPSWPLNIKVIYFTVVKWNQNQKVKPDNEQTNPRSCCYEADIIPISASQTLYEMAAIMQMSG